MIVEVQFTIETKDFGGKEFKQEIERLLADIAKDAHEEITLLTFQMKEEGGSFADWRAIQWEKERGEC